MDITINFLGMMGIIVPSMIIGYFIGRYERKTVQQEDAQEIVEIQKTVVSPVAGEVSFFCEGNRRGVVIEPEQGMVYAPISGKVSRLYPMGNAFVLQSNEPGDMTELLIQVGRKQPDELCSMYYRSRIVENEIVNKGKLLLMFDKESLMAAGEEVLVYVSLEEGMSEREVIVTQKEKVKIGEEILKINGVMN